MKEWSKNSYISKGGGERVLFTIWKGLRPVFAHVSSPILVFKIKNSVFDDHWKGAHSYIINMY
jgi:hypothetical protein